MENFKSIDDILDFAIQQEQSAVDFYNELAEKVEASEMKNVFSNFAREEMGHKAKLINVKETGIYTLPSGKVLDLKMSEYITSTQPHADMTYQEALMIAMNREKAAFKLYLLLSEKAPNLEIQNLFLMLAQEESKHKLRFELEYDEFILKEN
jgi:rubrerythrin